MSTDLMLTLTGKRVLVTGGASGIGRATAETFIKLGASVVIADLSADLLRETCAEIAAVAAVPGNVTVEADCDAMVASVVEHCGGIDAVVHAAGVSDSVVKALDADVEAWQRVVDITLRGTFLICRAAGRVMVPQRSGSIVNFSSVNGLAGIPRRHAYGPAKAAVALLTRNLASEWGGSGVRVNALAPAYIRTPLVSRLIDQGKIDTGRLEARTPAGRLGEPEEVALAAAFLVSDWASYITGAILPVDGGWTAYGGPGDVETA